MGMHEFEDLVEASVKLLSSSKSPTLRDACKTLYDFQGRFDCGYTHFRVMDILLETRFVYAIAMTDHPEYAKYTTQLDALAARKEDWLSSFESDPTDVAYWKAPKLYFDAGSPLWQRCITSGLLSGDDARAPVPTRIEDVALEVVRLAEQSGQRELIAWWYALLPVDVMSDAAAQSEVLDEVFAIAVRNGAPSANNRYGMLRYPEREHVGEMGDGPDAAFMERWFEPVWRLRESAGAV